MLAVDGITVQFGGIAALVDVSFRVAAGEICGLIGPNGAGKTTLLDVVSGIRMPRSGCVTLDGDDVSRLGPEERCQRGLRQTFQRVQTFGWLTVEDNILVATERRGGGGGLLADLVAWPPRRRRERERRELAGQALERCGLANVRSEFAGALPIGVARMVEFARATVDPPKLLLLDEPASGLDEQEVALLAERIRSIRTDTGCAVLLVEHNAGFVMDLCDRVVVLDRGSVLADGSPAEIQEHPQVREAYLGQDHTFSGGTPS